MNVNINTVQFKADKELKSFISERVNKLSGLYNGVVGGEVTLRIDNAEKENDKVSEIKLMVKGNNLFAKKQSKTFEEATDSAVEALRKQLLKYKEKIKERK